MVCSVRHGDAYAYYDSPTPPNLRGARRLAGLGTAIDDALPALPAGARRTGQGVVARGVLCRKGSSVALGTVGSDVLSSMVTVALVGGGVLALYALLTRPR